MFMVNFKKNIANETNVLSDIERQTSEYSFHKITEINFNKYCFIQTKNNIKDKSLGRQPKQRQSKN